MVAWQVINFPSVTNLRAFRLRHAARISARIIAQGSRPVPYPAHNHWFYHTKSAKKFSCRLVCCFNRFPDVLSKQATLLIRVQKRV